MDFQETLVKNLMEASQKLAADLMKRDRKELTDIEHEFIISLGMLVLSLSARK